ncbi:MAG TPA: hypothetical protein VFP84_38670 [Kofleriaceae bacterium]|nr:hypothetical protein [Kofleriaceae bacterium]
MQTEQLHHHKRADQAGGGPDVDAEHDPQRATKASNAALKRVAEAGGAPPGQALASQRETANQATTEGLRNAVMFATFQISHLATDIQNQANAKLDEAGWDRPMQQIQANMTTAQSAVDRLGREIGLARTAKVPMEQIKQMMAALDRSCVILSSALHAASRRATAENQPFTASMAPLDMALQQLYSAHGWQAKELYDVANKGPDVLTIAKQSPNDVLGKALSSNLVALKESAITLGLSLKGSDVGACEADLGQMIVHLLEVQNLVQRGDHASLRRFKAQAAAAVEEAHKSYSAIPLSSPLVSCRQRLDRINFLGILNMIRAQVIR